MAINVTDFFITYVGRCKFLSVYPVEVNNCTYDKNSDTTVVMFGCFTDENVYSQHKRRFESIRSTTLPHYSSASFFLANRAYRCARGGGGGRWDF